MKKFFPEEASQGEKKNTPLLEPLHQKVSAANTQEKARKLKMLS